MEAQNNMPRDVFTRIIRGDMNFPPVQQAVAWFNRIADRNHFDPDVLTYPSTALIQAYSKQTGKPLLYMPVHKVYMMEALGPAPDASGYDIAAALGQIVKSLAWDAPKDGVGELYYACTDPTVDAFCREHGFTRMTYNAGLRERPMTDEEKQGVPPRKDGEPHNPPIETTLESNVADMPHYKFKVFRTP
jgi:hypothetical protein